MNRLTTIAAVAAIIVLLGFVLGLQVFKTVPAGRVGVAELFGDIKSEPYPPGLHFPVNPLYRWTLFDTRDKTQNETVAVPSQDALQTSVDVSIQYNLIGGAAPQVLGETGSRLEDAVRVYLVPAVRSIIREQGKSIPRAEDFFLEETQQRIQASILADLSEYLEPLGLNVSAVFLRDITLPASIMRAIEQKKEREQEVEKQRAELERFRTEQQQLIAQAEAERQAAELQAQQVRLLADARAYEIRALNDAIASNPAYVQLQALEALKQISKDPSSKLYFINGESTQPLPLMNIGEPLLNR